MQVGEIAAAAAGDPDLVCWPLGMVQDQYLTAPLGRLNRTHQSGGTATEHKNIQITHSGGYTGNSRREQRL